MVWPCSIVVDITLLGTGVALLRVGVALCVPLGVDFEISKAQARPSVSLPAACRSSCRPFSYFSSIMCACLHELNPQNCKLAPAKCFLLCGHGASPQP